MPGGAGCEVGRQVWVDLGTLVRHPLRGGQDTDDASTVSSGPAELAELDRFPVDPVRVQALSSALAPRAAEDADLRRSGLGSRGCCGRVGVWAGRGGDAGGDRFGDVVGGALEAGDLLHEGGGEASGLEEPGGTLET